MSEPELKVERLRTPEKAAVEVMYDACVEILEQPHPMIPNADYFKYRLGTAGHFYAVEGMTEIIEEHLRYRNALEEIVRRCEAGGLHGLIDVPRKALNPDG